MFSVCFRRRVRCRHRRRKDFYFSRQNRLSFTLDIWDKESMGLGKCTGWPLVTLTQGHGCDIDKHKFGCLQDKVRTAHPITTKLGSSIPRVMFITWLDFGGILFETLFLPNSFWKFWMCFFKVKHSIGHISGMVGPTDVKQKGGASVGWIMWPWPLTSPMTLTL